MPRFAKKFRLRINLKKAATKSPRLREKEEQKELNAISIEDQNKKRKAAAAARKRKERERKKAAGIKEPKSTERVRKHRENLSLAKMMRDTKKNTESRRIARNKLKKEQENQRLAKEEQTRLLKEEKKARQQAKRRRTVKESEVNEDEARNDDEADEETDDDEDETGDKRTAPSRATLKRKRKQLRENILGTITTPEYRAKVTLGSLTPKTKTSMKKMLKIPDNSRTGRPRKLSFDQEDVIKNYWCKDNISRVLPGKKRQYRKTIKIRQDDKMVRTNVPKRYLYFTQAEVFQKFKAEHPDIPISRSTFYRLRPAEVVQAPPSSRLTCGCCKCINFKSLSQEIIETGQRPSEFVNEYTCGQCDLTQCTVCTEKMIADLNLIAPDLDDKKINWYQVETVEKKAKLVRKEGTRKNAKELLVKMMPAYVKHTQLVKQQHYCYEKIRENLKNDQLLIISDYSENWTIKYPVESQSMHFSEHQVVILTVVVTMRDEDGLFDEIHLFMSEKIDKINANIQKCHKRIIDEVESRLGKKTGVYEITDGCAQQYKSRKVLGWMTENCPKNCVRYYWESGHGKSKGDGAGGTIKVQLDRAVIGQQRIFLSAKEVYDFYQQTLAYDKPGNVTRKRVFHFLEANEAVKKDQEKDYKRIPGTQSIRQVLKIRNGVIGSRRKGCACDECLQFKLCKEKPYQEHTVAAADGAKIDDGDKEINGELEDVATYNVYTV